MLKAIFNPSVGITALLTAGTIAYGLNQPKPKIEERLPQSHVTLNHK